jgi:hypothetical protein
MKSIENQLAKKLKPFMILKFCFLYTLFTIQFWFWYYVYLNWWKCNLVTYKTFPSQGCCGARTFVLSRHLSHDPCTFPLHKYIFYEDYLDLIIVLLNKRKITLCKKAVKHFLKSSLNQKYYAWDDFFFGNKKWRY